MAGCLVYSSIASIRSGVGLGARGATRVKLGSPNSGINSMRSRAAARDTTPERAGVSEISRVAGRATLSFLPTHRAQWLRLSGGPRGLLRLLHALDRGAGAGRKLLQQKLNTSSFWCSPSGPGCEVVETPLALNKGRQFEKAASFLAQQSTGP